MDWVAVISDRDVGMLTLAGAVVLLYVATRVATGALLRPGEADPGRRALAQWLPIVLVTLLAVAQGHGGAAVAVIFATSVFGLSLVLGVVAVQAPVAPPVVRWRRVWPFILPAGVLALLAGFRGHLTLTHALVFALQGLVVWAVWREPRGAAEQMLDFPPAHPLAGGNPDGRESWMRAVELALAVLAAVVGAWLAVRGVVHIGLTTRGVTAGVATVALLAPGVMLPMVATGSRLALRGQGSAAASAVVGVALLNLCVLLPAAILLWHGLPALAEWWRPEAAGAWERGRLVVPLGVWRVDSIVLIVLGLVLLPVALGRWSLGRREGLGLIAGYALYFVLTVLQAGR
jgi:Ca2+/Na+ antiporter